MIIEILDSELRGIDEKIKIYSKYTSVYSWIIYSSLGFSFLVTTLAGSVNLSQISDRFEIKIAWSIILWVNSVLCGLVAYTRPILERYNMILKKYKIVQKYLNMFKTSNTVTRDALVNIIKLLDETDSEAFSFTISDIQNPDINVSVPLNRNNINYITNVIDRLTPRIVERQTIPIQNIVVDTITPINNRVTANDATIVTPELQQSITSLDNNMHTSARSNQRINIPKLTWRLVDTVPYEPQPLTSEQLQQVRNNIEPPTQSTIQYNMTSNIQSSPYIANIQMSLVTRQPSVKLDKVNKTIERLLLMRNKTYNFINTMPIVYSVSNSNSTNTSLTITPNPTPETLLHNHSMSTRVLHDMPDVITPELRHELTPSFSLHSNNSNTSSELLESEHPVGNIPIELAASPIAEAIKTLESTFELNTPNDMLMCNIHLDPNEPRY